MVLVWAVASIIGMGRGADTGESNRFYRCDRYGCCNCSGRAVGVYRCGGAIGTGGATALSNTEDNGTMVVSLTLEPAVLLIRIRAVRRAMLSVLVRELLSVGLLQWMLLLNECRSSGSAICIIAYAT